MVVGAAAVRTEVSASPSAEDCKVVIGGLAAFNESFAELHNVSLAVLVREAGGATLGGLLGHTGGGWFQIDVLWLPDPMRGSGLGRRLMVEGEVEARGRGCVGAFVNTGSFQAPGFYQKLGYTVCGVIAGLPRGHSRITLSKRLDGMATSTGTPSRAG